MEEGARPPASALGPPGGIRHPMASVRVGALLTAVVGIGALSIDMSLASLPEVARRFRCGAPEAELTVTLFLLSFAVAQLALGPSSDRLGRRRVLLGGLALYVVGGLACTVANSVAVLVAARVLQGFGAGSGPVVGRAIVRDVYPREHGARVLGLMAAAQALNPVLAPILGGYLQSLVGWRSVFGVQAAAGVVFFLGALRLVAETAPGGGPTPPGPGALWRDAWALLRDRPFLGYALSVALVFSGQFAFISGSAFVLIEILGLAPSTYGWCFGFVALGLMSGGYLTARYTVRLGTRALVRAGALLSAGAGGVMALLVLLGSVHVPGIVAPMYLYAVGAGLVMPSGTAGALGPHPRVAGLASALLGFLQMAGSALYSVGVSRLYDGTALPMTAAIAGSGLGCLACYGLLLARAPQEPAPAAGPN